jgi:hypothetical protein
MLTDCTVRLPVISTDSHLDDGHLDWRSSHAAFHLCHDALPHASRAARSKEARAAKASLVPNSLSMMALREKTDELIDHQPSWSLYAHPHN